MPWFEGDFAARDFSIDALLCGISYAEARKIKLVYRKRHLQLSDFEVCPRRPSICYAKSKSWFNFFPFCPICCNLTFDV